MRPNKRVGVSSVMNQEDVIHEIQHRYRQLSHSLNEFERRHWAATEAIKLGRGGITIVCKALRMSPNTIKRGIDEITTGGATDSTARIRKPGGGRKAKQTLLPGSEDNSVKAALQATRSDASKPESPGIESHHGALPLIRPQVEEIIASDR